MKYDEEISYSLRAVSFMSVNVKDIFTTRKCLTVTRQRWDSVVCIYKPGTRDVCEYQTSLFDVSFTDQRINEVDVQTIEMLECHP